MIKLIIIILMSWPGAVLANEPFKINHAAFEFYDVGSFRDYDFQESDRKNDMGMAFLLDLSVTDYLHWKNRMWTNGNRSKLYTVGWEYDISLRPVDAFEIFHYHHSQHAMDEQVVGPRFPLRNYYGVRFNFVGTP